MCGSCPFVPHHESFVGLPTHTHTKAFFFAGGSLFSPTFVAMDASTTIRRSSRSDGGTSAFLLLPEASRRASGDFMMLADQSPWSPSHDGAANQQRPLLGGGGQPVPSRQPQQQQQARHGGVKSGAATVAAATGRSALVASSRMGLANTREDTKDDAAGTSVIGGASSMQQQSWRKAATPEDAAGRTPLVSVLVTGEGSSTQHQHGVGVLVVGGSPTPRSSSLMPPPPLSTAGVGAASLAAHPFLAAHKSPAAEAKSMMMNASTNGSGAKPLYTAAATRQSAGSSSLSVVTASPSVASTPLLPENGGVSALVAGRDVEPRSPLGILTPVAMPSPTAAVYMSPMQHQPGFSHAHRFVRVNGVGYPELVAQHIPRYYLPKPHLKRHRRAETFVLTCMLDPAGRIYPFLGGAQRPEGGNGETLPRAPPLTLGVRLPVLASPAEALRTSLETWLDYFGVTRIQCQQFLKLVASPSRTPYSGGGIDGGRGGDSDNEGRFLAMVVDDFVSSVPLIDGNLRIRSAVLRKHFLQLQNQQQPPQRPQLRRGTATLNPPISSRPPSQSASVASSSLTAAAAATPAMTAVLVSSTPGAGGTLGHPSFVLGSNSGRGGTTTMLSKAVAPSNSTVSFSPPGPPPVSGGGESVEQSDAAFGNNVTDEKDELEPHWQAAAKEALFWRQRLLHELLVLLESDRRTAASAAVPVSTAAVPAGGDEDDDLLDDVTSNEDACDYAVAEDNLVQMLPTSERSSKPHAKTTLHQRSRSTKSPPLDVTELPALPLAVAHGDYDLIDVRRAGGTMLSASSPTHVVTHMRAAAGPVPTASAVPTTAAALRASATPTMVATLRQTVASSLRRVFRGAVCEEEGAFTTPDAGVAQHHRRSLADCCHMALRPCDASGQLLAAIPFAAPTAAPSAATTATATTATTAAQPPVTMLETSHSTFGSASTTTATTATDAKRMAVCNPRLGVTSATVLSPMTTTMLHVPYPHLSSTRPPASFNLTLDVSMPGEQGAGGPTSNPSVKLSTTGAAAADGRRSSAMTTMESDSTIIGAREHQWLLSRFVPTVSSGTFEARSAVPAPLLQQIAIATAARSEPTPAALSAANLFTVMPAGPFYAALTLDINDVRRQCRFERFVALDAEKAAHDTLLNTRLCHVNAIDMHRRSKAENAHANSIQRDDEVRSEVTEEASRMSREVAKWKREKAQAEWKAQQERRQVAARAQSQLELDARRAKVMATLNAATETALSEARARAELSDEEMMVVSSIHAQYRTESVRLRRQENVRFRLKTLSDDVTRAVLGRGGAPSDRLMARPF